MPGYRYRPPQGSLWQGHSCAGREARQSSDIAQILPESEIRTGAWAAPTPTELTTRGTANRTPVSILGEPVHPERQFSALQVAMDLRALRNCEFAAEAAQERRQMPIEQD